MKKCWPCRRRRLKCDGGVPGCRKCDEYGVECTYSKPLTWVKGVASRGHMMGTTFGAVDVAHNDTTLTPRSPQNGHRDPRDRPDLPPTPTCRSVGVSTLGSKLAVPREVSRPLIDPAFQDLGYNKRFLFDYCKLPSA